MKGKKFLAFSLTVAMLAGSALTVSAAGVSDVFSAGYYADKYGDLKATYGTDEAALLEHFMSSGAKEGRVMSPILDVAKYRAAYSDLNAVYGDDWDAYVNHYLTYGINEGRKEGVLFDLKDYAAKNPDVKDAYGNDYAKIAKHYVTFGMKEGRKGGTIALAVAKAVAGSSNTAPVAPVTPTTPTTPDKPTTPTTPAVPAEPSSPTNPSTNHKHADGETLVALGLAQRVGVTEATCYMKGHTEYRCLEPIWEIKNGEWQQVTRWDPDYQNADGTFGAWVPQICGVIWREETDFAHVKPQNGNIGYKAPTCKAAGYEKFVCERCHQTVTLDLPQLVGHNFDLAKGAVLVKETQTTGCSSGTGKLADERGYKLIRCAGCDETKTEYKAPLEHNIQQFPYWDKKPTCSETGISYGYCNRCGEKVTRVEPALKHEFATIDYAKSNAFTRTAQQNGATVETVGHNIWTLTYCTKCGEIHDGASYDYFAAAAPVVTATAGCADTVNNLTGAAGKDGLCDVCGLRMDRNPIEDEAFEYTPGRDKYNGLTKN